MPMTYAPPEVALEHAGKTIYHAYKNNQWDERHSYWFTTDFAEGEEFIFDVRELQAWPGVKSLREQFGALLGDLQQVIRQAIDDGEIVFPAPPQVTPTTTIFVLDDGETYGGWGAEVGVTQEQLERIIEGEKVRDVVPDWNDHVVSEHHEAYRAAAKNKWHKDGEIEVDNNARVSIAAPPRSSEHPDDAGAYVQAWVWVYDDDLQLDNDEESHAGDCPYRFKGECNCKRSGEEA